MTNSQLYLSMAVPTLAVLVGILVNLVQISGVRGEMGSIRGEMGSIRGEIASLRAGQDMLTGKIIELVDRISRLETKNER